MDFPDQLIIYLLALILIIIISDVSGKAAPFFQFNEVLANVVTNIDSIVSPTMFLLFNNSFLIKETSPLDNLSFKTLNEPQFVFTNASKMPRRNSYSPWEFVNSGAIGKFLPSIAKHIVLVTKDNFNLATNLSLKYVTRVDSDIFIVVGEEQLIRSYFLTSFGKKLRNRLGIVFEICDSNLQIRSKSVAFMIDPLIFNDGKMVLTHDAPKITRFFMNGRTLRVSANTLAPYIVFISSSNTTRGTHYMMLMLSASTYNFTLQWDINPTRGNGKLAKDGTASGMLGDVLNGKADIAFIARLTLGQIGIIDLTTSNYVDTLVFITRRPETYLEWTAVINLFTLETWGIILSVFLITISLYYLKLQRTYGFMKPVTPFKAFMIPFGILLTQSVPRIPERTYLLTFFWMIFVLNLNIAYNSNLISFLTKLQPEKVPTSFDDLALRKDYNISFNYLNNGSCDCFHFFNESTNPMIIGIQQRFMQNLEPDTGKCILRALVQRKHVCIGWESVAMIGIAQNATLYAGLKLVTVSRSVHSSRNSIGFERHSVYTKSFDKIFGWFRDMGIVVHLKTQAAAVALDNGQTWLASRKHSKIYKILKKFVDDIHVKVIPFEMDHFKFAYIVFFGGSILAGILFFLEHMTSTNIRKKDLSDEYFP